MEPLGLDFGHLWQLLCAKTMLKCKSSQGLSYETNPVKTSQGFLTGGGGIFISLK